MRYADTYVKLSEFGRELLNKKSLPEGLPLISKYVKDVSGADRCSIFINDTQKQELWTTIADGIDKIVVSSDEGIVGRVLKEKKPIVVNDVSLSPDFLSKIDLESGYKTTNIIASPIFDSTREVAGVLEVLNKEGGFDDDDIKFMVFFSNYISGFLELVNVYK
jgi:signal transduction protein with GAF and PtsI domain